MFPPPDAEDRDARAAERETEELDLAYRDLAAAGGLRALRLPACRSLWRLVLAGCGLDSLPGLSSFAALGLLDVSRNRLKPQALQLAVADVELLRLRAAGNPPTDAAAGGPDHYRGFLVHALPRVWCLDGTYVSHAEREMWNAYFTEGRGRFADVKRKCYVAPQHFVPTRARSALPQLRPRPLPPPPPDPAKRASPRASELTARMPQSFAMPRDRELWRLDALCRDLERDARAWAHATDGRSPTSVLKGVGPVAGEGGGGRETPPPPPPPPPPRTLFPDRFVRSMVMDDEKDGGFGSAARATLALLLLASLIPGVPSYLVDDVVHYVFLSVDSSTCLNVRWWASFATPFRWPARLQLDLVTLLIASLTLEVDSASAAFSMHSHLRRCIRLLVDILADVGPGSPASRVGGSAGSVPGRPDRHPAAAAAAAAPRRPSSARPPREAFAEALAAYRGATTDAATLEILVLFATLAPNPSAFVDCFDDLLALFAKVASSSSSSSASSASAARFPACGRLARYRLDGGSADFDRSVEAKLLMTCAAEELLAEAYGVPEVEVRGGAGNGRAEAAAAAAVEEAEADGKPPLNVAGGKVPSRAAWL